MGLIRTLLAISVVIAHSSSVFGIDLVGGQIAVQAFYIISGFYMSLILNEKYIGANGSYKLFISNRFLRLFPIYWVVLILTVLTSYGIYEFTGGEHSGMLASYIEHWDHLGNGSFIFLVFTNLGVFLQDMLLFLGLDLQTGSLFFTDSFINTEPKVYKFLMIPQGWTIGIELMFYLIAPFLVRNKLPIVLMLIALSLGLRLLLYYGADLTYDPWLYRFFPTELVFFLFGNISYKMHVKYKKNKATKNLGIGGLILILLMTFTFKFVPYNWVMFAYFTLFFLAIPFVFELSKSWKWDRWIGELSYPIYISHMLVVIVVSQLSLPTYGGFGFTVIAITLVLAVILNKFVAERIEVIRQKRVQLGEK